MAGHKSTIETVTYTKGKMSEVVSYNVYTRIPFLLSYNLKRFYLDIGAAPCLRIAHIDDNYDIGAEIPRLGLTYTAESHLGYYLPVKKQRLFLEAAVYFFEIDSRLVLPVPGHLTDARYRNHYSYNFQISIGYMMNFLKTD